MKRTGPTNPILADLIKTLSEKGYKEDSNFLLDIAARLKKPARIRAEVNISRLNLNLKEGETAIIPGKVLGSGMLDKKINVSAWAFSLDAKEKIEKAGGKCLSIEELVEKNPKGTGIRIIC